MTLEQWQESTLENFLVRNYLDPAEVEHILDYLRMHPQVRKNRLSVPQAAKAAKLWTKRLNKKNKGLKSSGGVAIKLAFADGMKIVHLKDQTAKNWEGKHMGHCVASYSDHRGIYSLRDRDDVPHCTMEVKNNEVRQLKGRGNGKIVHKYHTYIIDFLKTTTYEIVGDQAVFKDLGFFVLSQAAQKILKDSFDNLELVKVGRSYFVSGKKPLRLKKNNFFSYSLIYRNLYEFLHRIVRDDISSVLEFMVATQNDEVYGRVDFDELGFGSFLNDNFDKVCAKASLPFLIKILSTMNLHRRLRCMESCIVHNRLDLMTWILNKYSGGTDESFFWLRDAASREMIQLTYKYHPSPQEFFEKLAKATRVRRSDRPSESEKNRDTNIIQWFPQVLKYFDSDDIIYVLNQEIPELTEKICTEHRDTLEHLQTKLRLRGCSLPVVKKLIEIGIDLSLYIDDALDYAATLGKEELIMYYLSLGAKLKTDLKVPMKKQLRIIK